MTLVYARSYSWSTSYLGRDGGQVNSAAIVTLIMNGPLNAAGSIGSEILMPGGSVANVVIRATRSIRAMGLKDHCAAWAHGFGRHFKIGCVSEITVLADARSLYLQVDCTSFLICNRTIDLNACLSDGLDVARARLWGLRFLRRARVSLKQAGTTTTSTAVAIKTPIIATAHKTRKTIKRGRGRKRISTVRVRVVYGIIVNVIEEVKTLGVLTSARYRVSRRESAQAIDVRAV
ncbi:MAG: hypothetical protein WCD43_01020 [Candidatus Acidiferrales bacterium]